MRITFLPALFALASAYAAPPEQVEFFEKRIRPVLAETCHECHGAEKQKGGLRLDSRPGWQKGGDTGAAIVPGKPAESLLLKAIRHDDPDLKMPAKRPKLDAAAIADFEKWIALGAPDPRDEPTKDRPRAWAEILSERKAWWSLQPVGNPAPPPVKNAAWACNDVDRFLLAKMENAGLAPAQDADPRTLIRRLSYVLTGLPPSPGEVEQFVQSAIRNPQSAIAEAADRLMGSPRFGEHWARHWGDIVRYADSHGSEGDPEIPEAWRYRDYLIRAFNDDVPIDVLIREHIAGDQLPPRPNAAGGWNESLLGLTHWRLVEHGFQPVDTRDEQVKTVDSQIDVFTKAFQGLTVSCARCHDHKFDAISQRDYTALAGVMESSRPAMRTIDLPEKLNASIAALSAAKARVKAAVAEAWLAEAAKIPAHLAAPESNSGKAWSSALAEITAVGKKVIPANTATSLTPKFTTGPGVGEVVAGDFSIDPEGDAIFTGLRPAGVGSSSLTGKFGGIATTERFKITTDYISIRAAGRGAWCRLIVDGYPIGTNPIFPRTELNAADPQWKRIDVKYRKGSTAYVEFSCAEDLTRREKRDERSWFFVDRIVAHDGGTPPEPPVDFAALLGGNGGEAERVRDAFTAAITAWRDGKITEPQRALLDLFVRKKLLPTAPVDDKARALLAEFRRIEAAAPVPIRAPGIFDADCYDAPLLTRGDHNKPTDPVPRGYLAALSTQPVEIGKQQSGRLQLANAITSPKNPLTARVMANRVWLHVFGRGIVATPDNFGKMGALPTHPELLDHLATHLIADGWSLKKSLRTLVTSRAFALAGEPSAQARESDPGDALLSHFRVRRMEAESIRDSMLALAGQLEPVMFGPPLPSDKPQRRRSIYLAVRRTALNPFLMTFDMPVPFSTLGSRDVTNVPAQSLTLLNDPFVIRCAGQWAAQGNKVADTDARLRSMFVSAFSRPPADPEFAAARRFLTDLGVSPTAWRDVAQSLFNLKEFIYLR